jgi:hypothetical protein
MDQPACTHGFRPPPPKYQEALQTAMQIVYGGIDTRALLLPKEEIQKVIPTCFNLAMGSEAVPPALPVSG